MGNETEFETRNGQEMGNETELETKNEKNREENWKKQAKKALKTGEKKNRKLQEIRKQDFDEVPGNAKMEMSF